MRMVVTFLFLSAVALGASSRAAASSGPQSGARSGECGSSLSPCGQAPFTEADLAPLFPRGVVKRGRVDLEKGRYRAAARRLGTSTAPAARFLRAAAHVELGRGLQAQRVLAGLAKSLPDIADRIAFLAGRAHELAGDHLGAATAFGEVPSGSLFWTQAQLNRARQLDQAGEHARALDALAPLLTMAVPEDPVRGDAAADALLLAGRFWRNGKDSDMASARQAFIDCWAGHPLANAAATCRSELGALPGSAGAPPAPEDVVRHDEALLDANHVPSALADLEKLAPSLRDMAPGEPFACRARFALGRAYRRMRQYDKVVEVLRPVVDSCQDPHFRVRALHLMANAASMIAPEDGIALYRTLAQAYQAHPLAEDALFYEADLLRRSGRVEEAISALRDLADRYPNSNWRAEALFRIAWMEKQGGRMKEAITSFARIGRDYQASAPYEHARALYWQARLYAERNDEGDVARARDIWRTVAEHYPVGPRARLRPRGRRRRRSGCDSRSVPCARIATSARAFCSFGWDSVAAQPRSWRRSTRGSWGVPSRSCSWRSCL